MSRRAHAIVAASAASALSVVVLGVLNSPFLSICAVIPLCASTDMRLLRLAWTTQCLTCPSLPG